MADRLKVAFMLGDLNRGGTETLVLDVLNEHKNAPFDIVCIHRKYGPYHDAYKNSGVPLFQLAPKRFGLLSYFSRLRRLLKQERVDVIHAQQMLDCIYAKLAVWGLGIKVCLTFHGYYYGKSKIDSIIARLSMMMADRVIFVSRSQRDDYIKHYIIKKSSKFAVVYNGVDFKKLLDVKRHIKHVPVRLLMVGSFLKGRNHMTVCKLAKKLKESGIDYILRFAGRKIDFEPETYDECLSFCQENGLMDNVEFLGDCQTVPELLADSDIFVYDTNTDTFGIAVVEAIASGIPALVGGIPVINEVTENGALATVFVPGDEQSMFEKFVDIIVDYDSYSVSAVESSALVRDKYGIEKHIANLNDLYLSLL